MNVALHAQQLGIDAHIVSALGTDARGQRMREWLSARGMDTTSIASVTELPTGSVLVDLHDPQNVRYRIAELVAWDRIPRFPQRLCSDDVVVFGSLSCRSEANWALLQAHLPDAGFRVLDLNLRAPFYTVERVSSLLRHCDLLKVNEAEFQQLCAWFPGPSDVEDTAKSWMERFGFSELCFTRGELGACFFTAQERYESQTFAVDVVDTVGSGDAFLAALLVGRMFGHPTQLCLDEAAAVGALVASAKGANPRLDWENIREMTSKPRQSASS